MSYAAFKIWKGVSEYFISVPKESHFTEKGVLTPEEFVTAGDLIVMKCPTWSWASGEPSKRKDYLPADKQFLITKNVPCLKRTKALEEDAKDEEDLEGGDWIATHTSRTSKIFNLILTYPQRKQNMQLMKSSVI
jgi:ubiquitin-like-conjugating enzyme ATG3